MGLSRSACSFIPSGAHMSAVRTSLLWLLPATLAAQAPDSAVLARIRDEGFNRSKVFETAISISDIRGPRLAGSPQFREAAEWALKELTSWGMTNAMLEPWGTRGGRAWSVTRHSVEMT